MAPPKALVPPAHPLRPVKSQCRNSASNEDGRIVKCTIYTVKTKCTAIHLNNEPIYIWSQAQRQAQRTMALHDVGDENDPLGWMLISNLCNHSHEMFNHPMHLFLSFFQHALYKQVCLIALEKVLDVPLCIIRRRHAGQLQTLS